MPSSPAATIDIAKVCQRSQVGKLLPDALYVHISALPRLDPALCELERLAKTVTAQAEKATIIKFSFNKSQIAYLFYPDFDTEAHPALQSSIQVNLNTLTATDRDYSTTDNPPRPPPQRNLCRPRTPTLRHLRLVDQARRSAGAAR